MKQRISLICKGCGSKWFIRVDPEVLNPKAIRLNACRNCSKTKRKRAFRSIKKRMTKKEIPVKSIPRMKVIAKFKIYKPRRY